MNDHNAGLPIGKDCVWIFRLGKKAHARLSDAIRLVNENGKKGRATMKFKDKIRQVGATGYILLWILGIPIPILLIIFLLRGCT